MAERQLCHHSGSRRALGTVLFHEFHPCRGVVEQVPHTHGGALRAPGGRDLTGYAALQMQGRAAVGAPHTGENIQPRHGGDGRQRLAPETQRPDSRQVLRPAQLAGGVAQKRGRQLLRRDAAAVVRHPQVRHAAVLQLHGYGGRPGVQGVLQQLLAHAGGAFHHLAGSDEIGDMGRQLLYLRHGIHSFSIAACSSVHTAGSAPPGGSARLPASGG